MADADTSALYFYVYILNEMKDNNLILKAIIIASLVGIVFILGLILGERDMGDKAGFTELYFEDLEELPTEMKVNSTYLISFTVVSHEKEPVKYGYSVESGIRNLTGSFLLSPEKTKTITLELKPEEVRWDLSRSRYREWKNRIDLTEDSWIGRPMKLESIVAGNTTSELLQFIHNLPLVHNVDAFGNILFTNISVEELRREPLHKEYEYLDVNKGIRYRKLDVIDLHVENNNLILDRKFTETWYNKTTEKFSISIISETGDEYEIHFWYTVS